MEGGNPVSQEKELAKWGGRFEISDRTLMDYVVIRKEGKKRFFGFFSTVSKLWGQFFLYNSFLLCNQSFFAALLPYWLPVAKCDLGATDSSGLPLLQRMRAYKICTTQGETTRCWQNDQRNVMLHMFLVMFYSCSSYRSHELQPHLFAPSGAIWKQDRRQVYIHELPIICTEYLNFITRSLLVMRCEYNTTYFYLVNWDMLVSSIWQGVTRC